MNFSPLRRLFASCDTHTSEVKVGAAVSFALQMGGVALVFLQHVALARWMKDTAAYGQYATLLAFISVLAIVASLGLPQSIVRFIAAHRGRGDLTGSRNFVRMARSMVLPCGLGAGALVAAAALGFGWNAGWLAAAACIPCWTLGLLYSEACRGEQRQFLSLFPDRLLRPALLITGVWLAVRLQGNPDAPWVMTLLALVTTITVVVQILLFHAKAPALPPGHAPVTHPAPHAPVDRRVLLNTSFPLLLTGLFGVAMGQTDTFLMGTLSGYAQAGVYSAASRISLLAGLSLVIVKNVAAPAIATMHARGEHDKMARAVASFARWSFWPAAGCIAVLALLPSFWLGLFGKDYQAAAWPLLILLAGQLFNTGCGSVGLILNMTGHQKSVSLVVGVSAALNIVLNIILIPPFGAVGAAIANFATMVLWNLWLLHLVRKKLGIDASIVGAFRGGRA